MSYGFMKEFDCKVSSTWSVCGKVRAEAFAYRHLGKTERKSFRSWITSSGTSEEMTKSTSTMQEDNGPLWIIVPFSRDVKVFQKMNKKVDGLEADNRRAIITFQREVLKKG